MPELLIAVIAATWLLGRRRGRSGDEVERLAGTLEAIGPPVIVAAFVISVCMRVAQGSATVARTTTPD